MFSEKDEAQLQSKGITKEAVYQQIAYFKTGFLFTNVIKPATVGDGIIRLDEQQQEQHIQAYERQMPALSVYKFVPASGAASRMFKNLYEFISEVDTTENQQHLLSTTYKSVAEVVENLSRFAFYEDLKQTLAAQHKNLETLLEEQKYDTILAALLNETGLNYGNLPKGLLRFHRYGDDTRTPVEEHLVEGANYARSADGTVLLHFTVSPEHQAYFEQLVQSIKSAYEQQLGVRFDISFSQQQPYTDTLAVDAANQPFREEDGTLVFRPGGHGALIENLNNLDADVVFIKNIDNVFPDSLKETTYRWKKALGGVLLEVQGQIFDYLKKLERTNQPDDKLITEIKTFLEKNLYTLLPNDFAQKNPSEQAAYLFQKLNRPIRVCGMVKNEGEPGGGPFWAENADGTVSLQIVESAQIDTANPQQKELLQQSSHFNPVDLVCALKNYKGEKFNLPDFVDPQTGFISKKSKDGRELKALELPGLWNGAMADWNTVFVEVPILTFNPVKQVNDLLREQHQ